MSGKYDWSDIYNSISDEEVTNLAVGAYNEAVRRGIGETTKAALATVFGQEVMAETEKAAIAARLTEQEKLATQRRIQTESKRIAEEAAQQKQAAQQRRVWERRKGAAIAVKELMESAGFSVDGLEVNPWERGADRRLYIGYGYNQNKITYYQTGDSRNPPGTVVCDEDLEDSKEQIRAIAEAILQHLKNKFHVTTAIAWGGEAEPLL